jgi:hypothetical protein
MSLKKGSPLTPSREMNMLKAAIHLVNFCTSCRLLGGAIFVIANTFSGLGSIPRRETIYPCNFSEGISKVHFLGFNFILNFLRLSKVSAKSEMSASSSRVLTTPSGNLESLEDCILSWSQRLDQFGADRMNLFSDFIETSIINTHAPIFILFWYKYWIDKPI